MAKIHVLDKAVAELIAAGEVVERPASIVKELVENAVDAGATAVTVEIRSGGVRYIRVTDNGCGIDREDVPRAFLRHATSKVYSMDDLAGIHTLGFRGEALASIAAMCRVELTTRTADETEGTTCRVEGGELLATEPAGCPVGTSITVEDVFFNTPARMKFLKKDVSEGNAVAQVVEKCSLAHPEISFRLIRDGQTKLTTSGSGDLLAVIRAIYGKDFAGTMIPVDYQSENHIRVCGYLSNPSGAKASRAYQNFFVNGRYVRTRTAAAALEESFKNKLMSGKYPACVLDLQLEAETVDVNVHPAKTEVRFTDEKPVFHAVYFAAKTALSTLDAPLSRPAESVPPRCVLPPDRPETVEEAPIQPPTPVGSGKPQRMSAAEFRSRFGLGVRETWFHKPVAFHAPTLDIEAEEQMPPTDIPSPHRQAPQPEIAPVESDTVGNEVPAMIEEVQAGYRQIGELFSTYILLEQGNDLVLVDKHAAHERILYEQLRSNLRYGNRQVLLAPHTVTLAREDYDALLGDLERVEAMGFLIEDFGDGAVIVRETPIELGVQDIEQVVGEIAARIRAGNRDLTPEVLDRLYYNIACRAAVKGGDHSNALELQDICERLQKHPEITHCPHGRPVAVRLGKREIEKLFGRLG